MYQGVRFCANLLWSDLAATTSIGFHARSSPSTFVIYIAGSEREFLATSGSGGIGTVGASVKVLLVTHRDYENLIQPIWTLRS